MYEALKCFNLDDEFQGWIIVKGFQTAGTWLYKETELDDLNKQLEFLNGAMLIKDHWPVQEDPEVQQLLADPNFEPPEMIKTEIVDDEKSNIVLYEDGTVDEKHSLFVWKEVMAAPPSAEFERINKACEVIAQKRAGLTLAT